VANLASVGVDFCLYFIQNMTDIIIASLSVKCSAGNVVGVWGGIISHRSTAVEMFQIKLNYKIKRLTSTSWM
jgi:hypothetical protein